jgi:hypothetical protein
MSTPVFHGLSRARRNARGEKLLTITEYIESRPIGSRRERRVPMLRMRGEWLRKLGFESGARVVVTIEDQRIVLTVVSEE